MIGVVEPNRAESSVKISYPLRRVALPSADELRRLREIVSACWPQLRRVDAMEFAAAFAYVAHAGRRDRLDSEHSLSWWGDETTAWLRRHQLAPNVLSVSGSALLSAVIAHGDVAFTSPADFPHVSLGIQFGGGGHPSSGCWKSVLETGRLREPTPLDRPVAIKNPARVVQLALNHR